MDVVSILVCFGDSRSFRVLFVVFVFFKQKTAYEMRISDWSSDVCSSDLLPSYGRPSHRLFELWWRSRGGVKAEDLVPNAAARCVRDLVRRASSRSRVSGSTMKRRSMCAKGVWGLNDRRSEGRSVGKECGGPCRSGGSAIH